jgi:hypothetical protein
MNRTKEIWTPADAKAQVSEVVEGVQNSPQTMKREGTLADFLLTSPLRGSEIDVDRIDGRPRRSIGGKPDGL